MIIAFRNRKSRHKGDKEGGQGLVEYALILSLVAVVVVAILGVLGEAVADVYETIVCELNRDEGCGGCISEKLTITGGCSGPDLTANVSSSCSGAMLSIDGWGGVPPDGTVIWSSADVCTGAATSITVWSLHPDGNYASYSASPP